MAVENSFEKIFCTEFDREKSNQNITAIKMVNKKYFLCSRKSGSKDPRLRQWGQAVMEI